MFSAKYRTRQFISLCGLFTTMEAFVVSALKYRPKTFTDVVGQQAITRTLENALESQQLAQALLFCGPRGVGKTSCARILAKKINSGGEGLTDEDFAFNIFELDAASNNTVDDIRKLNEQVRIPPQRGTHKIYIIDEAHMLSIAAFNAFLKTLEEPPSYVIFILATTEKNKIIPTILSRCQVFDFKRIGILDIQHYLAKIAESNNLQFEEEALLMIAEKADGAMRDALSIFDRMVSFTQGQLTAAGVAENLNILDFDTYFEMTQKILSRDIPGLLLDFDALVKKGFESLQFVEGLGSHFRNLLLSKNEQTVSLLETAPGIKEKYKQQAAQANHELLLDAVERINTCEIHYKGRKNKRLHVELCLMQLASLHFDGEKKKAL